MDVLATILPALTDAFGLIMRPGVLMFLGMGVVMGLAVGVFPGLAALPACRLFCRSCSGWIPSAAWR